MKHKEILQYKYATELHAQFIVGILLRMIKAQPKEKDCVSVCKA